MFLMSVGKLRQSFKMRTIKRALIIVVCFLCIILSGCIEFETINQPSSASANDIISVSITAFTTGYVGDVGPLFGVCLPNGWILLGDSIPCTGVYNEVIYYDSSLSYYQQSYHPAPEGYYWWAGSGAGPETPGGIVNGEFEIQTGTQTGCYEIDYRLGDSYNGLNQAISDDHLLWIVDENTPVELLITEYDNSIFLEWQSPANTNGLVGYNVYCDQELINTEPIVDSTYLFENPPFGAHYYSLSSLYNNGDEYLLPYEVLTIFGGNLYVSPDGDNSNGGSSFEDALQTITYALSIITSDSLRPKTIMLAPGNYNPNTNGEQFPIKLISYVSIIGAGANGSILDADHQSRVMNFTNVNNISIEELTITNGYDVNFGGGIYCFNSSVSMTDVIISDNESYWGGGVYCVNNSFLHLSDVIISNNVGNWGGGILSRGYSSQNLERVTITGNTAVSGGGIFYLFNNNLNLTDVILSGNEASQYGGGIHLLSNDYLGLTGVVITDNIAVNGGGIKINGESNPNLVNCILWNNTPQEISPDSNYPIYITYSNIGGGWEGEGNIDIDPMFRDPDNGDFHLMATYCGDPYDSPCIDMGHPDILDSLLDCDWGMGWYRSDMGAYGGGDSVEVGIDAVDFMPKDFRLYQNYPNPFNASTTIRYELPNQAPVIIDIYDVLGRKVQTLQDGKKPAGSHSLIWQADDYSSGMYFYKLQAGDYIETKKMLLLK